MPELLPPHPGVRDSYLEACRDHKGGWRGGLDLVSLARPEAFALYCRALRNGVFEWQHTHGGGRMKVLWWCDADQYLGESTIRPDLTPEFGNYPSEAITGLGLSLHGHVGYDVRESARGRGHGKALLAATLLEAYTMGIDPVVLSVEDDNAASISVIEACGGIKYRAVGAVWQYLASGSPRLSPPPPCPAGAGLLVVRIAGQPPSPERASLPVRPDVRSPVHVNLEEPDGE